MEDIKIELPLCNQFDSAHDPTWVHRICAICSLWMLLKLHNSEFDVPVMELVQQGLANNAYMENIGWRHQGIVELAATHGLLLHFAEKFFYTPEEKHIGSAIIYENLRNNRPVIVSIFHHLNPAKSGHMVVVHGLQQFQGQAIGYYVQDPDASFRGHNYFLTRDEFLAGWRGGLIYR